MTEIITQKIKDLPVGTVYEVGNMKYQKCGFGQHHLVSWDPDNNTWKYRGLSGDYDPNSSVKVVDLPQENSCQK